MRKVLTIFAVVLAMTSLASAGLVLEGDGTPTGSLTGIGNTGDIDVLMIATGGTVDGGTVIYTGGAAVVYDTEWFENEFNSEFIPLLSLIETFNGLAPGSINQIFALDFDGLPNGTLVEFNAVDAPVNLQLVHSTQLTAIGDSITLVPEPATICLLGLGGLLLGRRKRA